MSVLAALSLTSWATALSFIVSNRNSITPFLVGTPVSGSMDDVTMRWSAASCALIYGSVSMSADGAATKSDSSPSIIKRSLARYASFSFWDALAAGGLILDIFAIVLYCNTRIITQIIMYNPVTIRA